MEVRSSEAGGVIFSIVGLGAALLSFSSLALWAFALALAAIFCGGFGLMLLQGVSSRREPLAMAGLAAGVIGLLIGIIRVVTWTSPLFLR